MFWLDCRALNLGTLMLNLFLGELKLSQIYMDRGRAGKMVTATKPWVQINTRRKPTIVIPTLDPGYTSNRLPFCVPFHMLSQLAVL